MAPDDRMSIRENGSYQYEVFDGEKWLATFLLFADAALFASRQTPEKERRMAALSSTSQATATDDRT